MALACLVCHSVESPSRSFRSYSTSSSENEGRCSAMTNCLARNTISKVAPASFMSDSQTVTDTPRLIRSRAVSRDFVQNWNFNEVNFRN